MPALRDRTTCRSMSTFSASMHSDHTLERSTWLIALLAAPFFGCGRSRAGDVPLPPDAVSGGLLAWYTLDDDPRDGVVEDHSGAGRDALCAASLTCPDPTDGRFGAAASFDGTRDFLRLYDDPLFAADAFSIAAFVRLPGYKQQAVLSKAIGSGTLSTWALWCQSDGHVMIETFTIPGTDADLLEYSGTTLPTNAWVHLGVTWDGTRKRLYVNGVLLADRATEPNDADDHDILIGADENSGVAGFYFGGSIDEVRIYDRALTPAEVAILAGL
ncbi:MAG: LamG domain-containing protein [Deltaproteobacteria bacterium]|nr:LamG domain-containing protein [Deltaproteobacteria bacterium]